MGGLLVYCNSVLDSSYNKFGQLVIIFVDIINKQLGQGFDLVGKVGVNLFGDINDLDIIVLWVLVKNGNIGNVYVNLNIIDISKLNFSDFCLDFDGISFIVWCLGDDVSMQVMVSGIGFYIFLFKDVNGVDQGFNLIFDQFLVVGDCFILQLIWCGVVDIEVMLKNVL